MTKTQAKSKSNEGGVVEAETVKVKFRTRDYVFLGAACILLSIVGPYIYYSGITYMHIHQYRASEAGSEFA